MRERETERERREWTEEERRCLKGVSKDRGEKEHWRGDRDGWGHWEEGTRRGGREEAR